MKILKKLEENILTRKEIKDRLISYAEIAKEIWSFKTKNISNSAR